LRHRAQRVLCTDSPRRRSGHRRRPSTSTRSTYPIATSRRFQLRCWQRSRLLSGPLGDALHVGEARLDRAQTLGVTASGPPSRSATRAATAAMDASDCADKSDGPYSVWSSSAFPCSEEIDCPSQAAYSLQSASLLFARCLRWPVQERRPCHDYPESFSTVLTAVAV
jgi:hypothetical protein